MLSGDVIQLLRYWTEFSTSMELICDDDAVDVLVVEFDGVFLRSEATLAWGEFLLRGIFLIPLLFMISPEFDLAGRSNSS